MPSKKKPTMQGKYDEIQIKYLIWILRLSAVKHNIRKETETMIRAQIPGYKQN